MTIHELAVRWAAGVAKEVGSDSQQEQRMAFGLELILGEIVKWIVFLSLAGILGILKEVLIITISAGSLRLVSGGEHCSAYYRCLIGGAIWFTLLGEAVSYLNPLLTVPQLYFVAAAVFIISLPILIVYAPGDTENKPIRDPEERKRFRNLSVLFITIYFLVMIGSASFISSRFLTLSLAVGTLAQVFTVSPWGYAFLHWVDRLLGFKGGSEDNGGENPSC